MAKNNEINLFNIYVLLLDESISGYELEKEVGISRTTLLKVRADKEKFLSLSINTLVKLQEWLNSDAGKAYLSSPANNYNLRVMEDLDLGTCDFFELMDTHTELTTLVVGNVHQMDEYEKSNAK